jgi:hypothetical protein
MFAGSQQVEKSEKQAKVFRITFVYRSIWNIFFGWEKREHISKKIGRTNAIKTSQITQDYICLSFSIWNIFYGWEKGEYKQKNR